MFEVVCGLQGVDILGWNVLTSSFFFRIQSKSGNPGLLAGRYPYKPFRDLKNIEQTQFLSHSSSRPLNLFSKTRSFSFKQRRIPPSNLQLIHPKSPGFCSWTRMALAIFWAATRSCPRVTFPPRSSVLVFFMVGWWVFLGILAVSRVEEAHEKMIVLWRTTSGLKNMEFIFSLDFVEDLHLELCFYLLIAFNLLT